MKHGHERRKWNEKEALNHEEMTVQGTNQIKRIGDMKYDSEL